MNRGTAALGLFLLAVAGCDTAVRSQTVTGMRVLAIKSEPPTARPGDKIRLEALVASTKENDPSIQLTWFACLTDFDTCAQAEVPGDDVLVLGSGPVAVVDVPTQALSGDTLIYWLDARRGGAFERSIKGIYIHPVNEPPNANPDLDRVRFGVDEAAPLGEVRRDTRVSVRAASSSMLNEVWKEAGEPTSEDVQIATFVTAGELVDPSGSGASGELYFQSPGSNKRVGTWIVVNDDRGGVDWFEHWITVKGKPE